jgi:hypothetical protein
LLRLLTDAVQAVSTGRSGNRLAESKLGSIRRLGEIDGPQNGAS